MIREPALCHHPADPVLIVEVAETSLTFDREHKGSLYARAGVMDYWIVNLVDRQLEVYRGPVAAPSAPFGWLYGRRQVLAATGIISALAVPSPASPSPNSCRRSSSLTRSYYRW